MAPASDVDQNAGPASEALKVENLNKTFRARPVLRDLSFRVTPGEALGVVGPNGSGKSTLLRILVGLGAPDTGKVILLGREVALLNKTPTALAQVSVVLGHHGLYEHLTALENLTFFGTLAGMLPKQVQAASLALLDEIGLAAFAAERPLRWSKGMRQRLVLARAFLRPPKVVVMDEPSDALDKEAVQMLRLRFAAVLKAGGIVVVASHDLAFLDGICNRLLVLRNGHWMEACAQSRQTNEPQVLRVVGDELTASALQSLLREQVVTSVHADSDGYVVSVLAQNVDRIIPAVIARGGKVSELRPVDSLLDIAYAQSLRQLELKDSF